MADNPIHVKDSPIPASPVLPAQLDENHVFRFRCYKGIDCFNACCRSIDIMLTPYDILRLKQRLGITSSEFLREYTEPFEFARNSIAGVKLKPKAGSMECQFVTDEGCSVYEDRPTACRYYPIGLLSMRRADENFDRASYALVREDHCHGHLEDRPISIAEYRREQGLEEYDEQGRSWRQLILKMKSAGPTVGSPSRASLHFFFMACYDIDRFREFVRSEGFQETYDVDAHTLQLLYTDDLALLHFGDRMIRQLMFGEETIPRRPDALEKHLARRRTRPTQPEEAERPSMAAYEMPQDGDDEKSSE
jgi:Fe-S-cluster containining protein